MRDAIETMGMLLPDDAIGRDAVHVAVFSAISDKPLLPSQHVTVADQSENGDYQVSPDRPTGGSEPIGIVDPFLSGAIPPGQRFWVYLYPRTITGLRHEWTHPSFEQTDGVWASPASKISSEQWLREFCASADCPGYDMVMSRATEIAAGHNASWDDEYMHFDGMDAHGEIPEEFWGHVENVLGRKIEGTKPKHFSCAC